MLQGVDSFQNSATEYMLIVEGISKSYRHYPHPADRLKEAVGLHPKREEFHALRDVTFSAKRGERIGIVGTNGSGKSTLLKIVSGVLVPTEGRVSSTGRVSALLELGIGFNAEITGRQNVHQYGLIQGLTANEMKERFDLIATFAELGEALEYPVRTYSSGMLVRLAFSCAVFSDPEILIVDEALSVGDAYFQAKCLHKIKELLNRGVMLLYVSHSTESVRSLCDRALLLEKGELILDASSDEVSREYERRIYERRSGSVWGRAEDSSSVLALRDVEKSDPRIDHRSQVFTERVAALRSGDGRVRVTDAYILSSNGVRTDRVRVGEKIAINVHLKRAADSLPEHSAICVGICDSRGNPVVHMNALDEAYDLADVKSELQTVSFQWSCVLCPGHYSVIIGLGAMKRHALHPAYWINEELFDHCVGGISFEVAVESAKKSLWGLVVPEFEVSEVRQAGRSDIFWDVYRYKQWGEGAEFYSGPGSHDSEIVDPYIEALSNLIPRLGSNLNCVDLGCGDFAVGSRIRKLFGRYVACDVVSSLIDRNRELYRDLDVEFVPLDMVEDDLPNGDIVLIRQTLQHLSNASIARLLPKLQRFRWVIVTEHLPSGADFEANKDQADGRGIRLAQNSGVVLTAFPFDWATEGEEILCEPRGYGGIIRTTLYSLRRAISDADMVSQLA
jgi:lipopolysaccharide transport system ATP-binding protein